jgi:hypothetical protein
MIRTAKMIKLKNKYGDVVWIDGATACCYDNKAKKITGKKRTCKTVEECKKGLALQSLITALECGFTKLHSIESCISPVTGSIVRMSHRIDKITDAQLPPCIYDAVQVIAKLTEDEHCTFINNNYAKKVLTVGVKNGK